MKTLTSTVAFQDESGAVLANGSLVLTLPAGVYQIVSGGGQVVGQSVIISLDANGKITGTAQVWGSDEISPQTPYTVSICRLPGGLQPIASAQWFISGTSPIDVSQLVNTITGISYAAAVLQTPTGPQNINGQPLNFQGAAVSFSASNSTAGDTWLTRTAAGVLSLGTAVGNALGTLLLGTIDALLGIFNSIQQPAATTFKILDNIGGTRYSIPSNGTGQATLNNTNILGGSSLGGSGATDPFTPFNRLKASGGTTMTAAKFGSLTGWGTTASVGAVAGTDSAFTFTVSSSGTGQTANPTLVVTFADGAWTNPPIVVATDLEGTGADAPWVVVSVSTTTLTLRFNLSSAVLAGTTAGANVICIGR
jgi:hypothetical protein